MENDVDKALNSDHLINVSLDYKSMREVMTELAIRVENACQLLEDFKNDQRILEVQTRLDTLETKMEEIGTGKDSTTTYVREISPEGNEEFDKHLEEMHKAIVTEIKENNGRTKEEIGKELEKNIGDLKSELTTEFQGKFTSTEQFAGIIDRVGNLENMGPKKPKKTNSGRGLPTPPKSDTVELLKLESRVDGHSNQIKSLEDDLVSAVTAIDQNSTLINQASERIEKQSDKITAIEDRINVMNIDILDRIQEAEKRVGATPVGSARQPVINIPSSSSANNVSLIDSSDIISKITEAVFNRVSNQIEGILEQAKSAEEKIEAQKHEIEDLKRQISSLKTIDASRPVINFTLGGANEHHVDEHNRLDFPESSSPEIISTSEKPSEHPTAGQSPIRSNLVTPKLTPEQLSARNEKLQILCETLETKTPISISPREIPELKSLTQTVAVHTEAIEILDARMKRLEQHSSISVSNPVTSPSPYAVTPAPTDRSSPNYPGSSTTISQDQLSSMQQSESEGFPPSNEPSPFQSAVPSSLPSAPHEQSDSLADRPMPNLTPLDLNHGSPQNASEPMVSSKQYYANLVDEETQVQMLFDNPVQVSQTAEAITSPLNRSRAPSARSGGVPVLTEEGKIVVNPDINEGESPMESQRTSASRIPSEFIDGGLSHRRSRSESEKVPLEGDDLINIDPGLAEETDATASSKMQSEHSGREEKDSLSIAKPMSPEASTESNQTGSMPGSLMGTPSVSRPASGKVRIEVPALPKKIMDSETVENGALNLSSPQGTDIQSVSPSPGRSPSRSPKSSTVSQTYAELEATTKQLQDMYGGLQSRIDSIAMQLAANVPQSVFQVVPPPASTSDGAFGDEIENGSQTAANIFERYQQQLDELTKRMNDTATIPTLRMITSNFSATLNDLDKRIEGIRASLPDMVSRSDLTDLISHTSTSNDSTAAGRLGYRCLMCGRPAATTGLITDREVAQLLGTPPGASVGKGDGKYVLVYGKDAAGRSSKNKKLATLPPIPK